MEKNGVQVLDRAFELLELLCQSQNGMTIQQLSVITGLHKSTVHRLLHTMMKWGYVGRMPDAAIYRPGLRLCELSDYIQENLDVAGVSRDILEHLSMQTSETVHLAMRDEEEIVYIHKVERTHGSIRMASRIGSRSPMFCTSVGKAILATLSDKEVSVIWSRSDITPRTPHTIVDKATFMAEIDRIRQRGYATDNEENELGVCCVAAAIPDRRGRASYAISISTPATRMTEDWQQSLVSLLVKARDEISAVLGGRIPGEQEELLL